MAKIKAKAIKARKTVKAKAAARVAQPRTSFSQGFSEPTGFRNRKKCNSISKVLQQQKGFLRQPLEMLQNGFNSVMSHFK